ncbi:hypothetical protein J1N10_21170, partial [Carboxylicivirga sp. A043]|uniref:TlpA family protein disulfide reductase n=1 Tax=Carboxylicivirga litoralis TaxID=2816963 RepID=UPI0021CB0281
SQIPTESSIKYDPGSKKLESFDVVDLNNELKSIELKKGKFFLLDSSIPACKGCLKGIPELVKLSNQNRDKLDVIILWSGAGNYENWKTYLKFIELNESPIPMVLDTKNIINQTFEINVFPTY